MRKKITILFCLFGLVIGFVLILKKESEVKNQTQVENSTVPSIIHETKEMDEKVNTIEEVENNTEDVRTIPQLEEIEEEEIEEEEEVEESIEEDLEEDEESIDEPEDEPEEEEPEDDIPPLPLPPDDVGGLDN